MVSPSLMAAISPLATSCSRSSSVIFSSPRASSKLIRSLLATAFLAYFLARFSYGLESCGPISAEGSSLLLLLLGSVLLLRLLARLGVIGFLLAGHHRLLH